MKRLISFFTAALIVGVFLVSQARAVELKAVTFMPKTDIRAAEFLNLLKLIEQRSNGAITTRFLGGAEVIPPMEIGDNVKIGNVQIAMSTGGWLDGLVPGSSMVTLSQLSSEEERKKGLWDKLNENAAVSGLRYLGKFMPQNDPLYYMGLRKVKPTSIKDLSGLKIGHGAPIVKAWVESMGMAFVQVQPGEAYNALDRGVVDAVAWPLLDHLNSAWYEVESYIIDHPVYVSNGYIIMNLKTFNALPKNLQDAITSAYLAWEPQTIKVQREAQTKVKQQIIEKKKADIFIKLPPTEAAMYVHAAYTAEWDRWAKLKPDLVKMYRPLMSK